MTDKPKGPIWVDFAPAILNQLPVGHLVQIANLALNRLTARDLAEIFCAVGLQIEINLVDRSSPDDGVEQ